MRFTILVHDLDLVVRLMWCIGFADSAKKNRIEEVAEM